MAKRRVFIAIPVPGDIKKEIAVWQKRHSHIPIRWIKEDNLHITVVPPWYVTDDEIRSVVIALKGAVLGLVSFSAIFEKILFGPPNQPARLIWAEGETPEEFAELKMRLENTLTSFIKKEKRQPKLHLTIARFRSGSIDPLPELNGKIDWKFEVNSIVLMESKLKRTGAEYAALQSFDFF